MIPSKWAKRGFGLLFGGMAGMAGIALLFLLHVANSGVSAEVELAALVILVVCVAVALAGISLLHRHCRCPHCGKWTPALPSPWQNGIGETHCTHCGGKLEYDNT